MATNYDKATGSTGTMRITDTGTTVEFWLKAGSGTYNYDLSWGYTLNGVTNNTKKFRFEMGGDWQKLSSWTVTTSQTVTFRLFDSGTSGLGGPTTHTANISRSAAPAAPSPVVLTNLSSTSMTATFTDGANNGAAIDSRELGYTPYLTGTLPTPPIPNAPTIIIPSDGSTDVTGLSPGTTYFFWARTHNTKGNSPWSVRSSATTYRIPIPLLPPTVAVVDQRRINVTFPVPTDNGGTPILEYQIGYGLTSTAPTSTVSGGPVTPNTVSGLLPGTRYYFWIRARNSVGWSNWSNPSNAKTISGVRIKVDGVWKEAIPYVRVGGVWVLARPWVRIMGAWKETN